MIARALVRIGEGVRLPRQLEGAGEALRAGCTEDEAAAFVSRDDLPLLYYHLNRLEEGGMLCRLLRLDGADAAELVPLSRGPVCTRYPLAERLQLSRFALLRREEDSFVLESPLARCRLFLRHPLLFGLLHGLGRGCTPEEFIREAALLGIDREPAGLFLHMLRSAGGLREEESIPLRQWDFHSLLFHTRSRRGRWKNAFLPFLGIIDPAPPLTPPRWPEIHRFSRPSAPARSFHEVVNARASSREPGARPLSVEKLGEVLYHAARVTYRRDADPAKGHHYGVAARPYPCAGACYELEIYLAVERCDGLEQGFYWHDPERHALCRVSGPTPEVDRLLTEASSSAGGRNHPDVLLVITARFGRVLWKYGGLGYSLILKDVGVLLQNLSLCAEASDLGACILGCGDSDLMAAAAGLDANAETSVGELMLFGERSSVTLRAST